MVSDRGRGRPLDPWRAPIRGTPRAAGVGLASGLSKGLDAIVLAIWSRSRTMTLMLNPGPSRITFSMTPAIALESMVCGVTITFPALEMSPDLA